MMFHDDVTSLTNGRRFTQPPPPQCLRNPESSPIIWPRHRPSDSAAVVWHPGGYGDVEARQTIRLSRTETDAFTALGVFLIAMLVLLCATVLSLHLLSGLPSIMVYGILFAVMVFGLVCAVAFLKSDISAKHAGPPQLRFRAPVARRRPPAREPRGARRLL